MNFWRICCDSSEIEKARLLMAERLRSSRTRLMSFSSEAASLGVTTVESALRPSLCCESVSLAESYGMASLG